MFLCGHALKYLKLYLIVDQLDRQFLEKIEEVNNQGFDLSALMLGRKSTERMENMQKKMDEMAEENAKAMQKMKEMEDELQGYREWDGWDEEEDENEDQGNGEE